MEIHEAKVELLVLPGMGEGYAKRGSAWAWTASWRDFVKMLNPKAPTNHVVYQITAPRWLGLSEGELTMLTSRIASAQESFLAQLEILTHLLFTRAVRRRAILDIVLYTLAILAIQFYWIIYLLIPDFAGMGAIAARKLKRAKVLERTERYWQISRDENLRLAVEDIWQKYFALSGSPLERYAELERYARDQAKTNSAYAKIESAYRDIQKHLTRESAALETVPVHTWRGRFLMWLEKIPLVPDPENVFPTRWAKPDEGNRPKSVTTGTILDRQILPARQELYLLWGRAPTPVIVPNIPYGYPVEALWRAALVAEHGEPLDFMLHVGSAAEKELIFASSPELDETKARERIRSIVSRIQNAALDVLRSDESYLAYHFSEWPEMGGGWMTLAMLRLGWNREDPFRNFVSWTFPWLFFANQLPMQSIIAASWLFVSPTLAELDLGEARRYFKRSLKGIHLSYKDVRLRVVVNDALGEVNAKMRSGASWREAVEIINLNALPPRLLHHATFNAIATESDQLTLGRREANNFIALPLFWVDGKPEFRPEATPQFHEKK